MSRWDYTLHFWPNGPVAADVDGDGEMKVVVTDGRSGSTFDGASGTLKWSKRLGTYGYGILIMPAAADVNGDVEVAADHGYHVRVLDQQYALTVEVKDDGGASIGCQVNLDPPNSDFGLRGRKHLYIPRRRLRDGHGPLMRRLQVRPLEAGRD